MADTYRSVSVNSLTVPQAQALMTNITALHLASSLTIDYNSTSQVLRVHLGGSLTDITTDMTALSSEILLRVLRVPDATSIDGRGDFLKTGLDLREGFR